MNKKFLRPVFTVLILLLVSCSLIRDVYGYTFFVTGETVYYYLAKGNYLFEYENRSNKQEIYKHLSDGTIIGKNTAVMKNFYTGQPWPYQGEETLSLNKYYNNEKNEKNDKFMNTVTMEIVDGAASIDEVAGKIGSWLRQNITYSLGTSTEPVSVYKTKRAFCEGYKNIVVELFSQSGLPAAGITCYIPPGHGWGSGGSGGNHAFARYYYPGYGWICLDPQATLNFADPYHLINFPAGNFIKDLKITDNSFVTDYQDEPKSWETFTACGKKEILHPVLIFKIIDSRGNPLHLPLFSFTSTFKELNLVHYKGRSFWSAAGLHVNQYPNGFSAVTSGFSPYNSFIYTQPEVAEIKGRDTLVINAGSCLFIKEHEFCGNGNYFFEADFQNDRDMKKLFLFNAEGKTLANRRVEIETGMGKHSMTSAADGSLSFKIPDESVRVILEENVYQVSFHENRIQYLPARPDFQQLTTAFLTDKKAGEKKPALLCTLFDKYGHISGDISGTMQIYTEKTRPVTVKATGGLLYYDNFQLDRDYYILVNSGNVFYRRTIRFDKNEIKRFEFSRIPADAAVCLSSENTLDASLVFYEYSASTLFAYPALEGKIYLDFPEGLYLFADNNKKERIIPVSVTGRKKEVVYAYAKLDFADFLTVNKLLYKTETGLAGTVRIAPETIATYQFGRYADRLEKEADREFLNRLYKKSWEWADYYSLDENATGEDRRRIVQLIEAGRPGAELSLVNLAAGRIDKLKTDSAGYFFFPAPAADTEYLLCYAVNENNSSSVLYTKHFRTDSTGICEIDLEVYSDPVLIRHSSGKNSWYSRPPQCYLLFPRLAAGRTATSFLEMKMNNRGNTSLFLDTGALIFSADKSLFSARLISAEAPVREYVLNGQQGKEEPLAAPAAVYNSFYPADRCLLLIKAADKNGKALANRQAVLHTDSGELKFTTDKNGFAAVEGLQEAGVYHLRYSGSGIYVDYPLAPLKSGVNTAFVDLRNSTCYTFSSGKTAGILEICFPKITREQLVLDSTRLIFSKKNTVDLFLEPGNYFFKAGADKILVDYTFNKSARYQLDPKAARDALPALQRLMTALYKEKPAYIIRFTDNNKLLTRYSAVIQDGKRKTTYKVQKDGLFYVTPPAGRELLLEYGAAGIFVRKALPPASDPVTVITDIKKEAGFVITLTGKNTAIRNRTMYLYTGASLDDKKRLKYNERLPVKTDTSGQAHMILPDGRYYLEVNRGEYRAVDIRAGKVKRLSLKI